MIYSGSRGKVYSFKSSSALDDLVRLPVYLKMTENGNKRIKNNYLGEQLLSTMLFLR